jgi:hypothetical protein
MTLLDLLEDGVMISSKALGSPNFTAMMQFIDWLYYSDAGEVFAKWGVEGVTYTGSVTDGTFKLEPNVDWAGLNPAGKQELNVNYGFFIGVFVTYSGSTQLLDTQFPPAELSFQRTMSSWATSLVPPPAPLSTLQQRASTLTGTNASTASSFRVWLREGCGDLESLNDAWYTCFWSQRYTSWDQVRPPEQPRSWSNPARRLDFARFTSDALLALALRHAV